MDLRWQLDAYHDTLKLVKVSSMQVHGHCQLELVQGSSFEVLDANYRCVLK